MGAKSLLKEPPGQAPGSLGESYDVGEEVLVVVVVGGELVQKLLQETSGEDKPTESI